MEPLKQALAGDRLAQLRRDYPEWQPWLALVETALREARDERWQASLPPRPPQLDAHQPLLSGAAFGVGAAEISRWLTTLLRLARQSGQGALAALGSAGATAALEPTALLQAALSQDRAALDHCAGTIGVDAATLRAVADLSALPLLHACRRRWGEYVAAGWNRSYCPICGAWPALAEEQGIERTRCLRCGRCGAAWQTDCLRCPYCDMTDHHQLTSLVPSAAGESRRIDACERCHGYLKAIAVLQASAPENVLLDDLATVDLDIAAIDAGFTRPAAPRLAPVAGVDAWRHPGVSTRYA